MSDDDIRRRVAEVFSTVLGHPVAVDDDVSAETEPVWDSLKQVELVLSVEDTFGVRFEADELPRLTSMDLLVAALSRRHAP